MTDYILSTRELPGGGYEATCRPVDDEAVERAAEALDDLLTMLGVDAPTDTVKRILARAVLSAASARPRGYVVTVKRRLAGRAMVPTADAGLQPFGAERYEVVSREPVATLAEAITVICNTASFPPRDPMATPVATMIPEQGSTVSLPDGQVITVELLPVSRGEGATAGEAATNAVKEAMGDA